MNWSRAKTVQVLGYKFHVKCRNLQSQDLHLFKSLFIPWNIFFFCQSRMIFFLLMPKVSRAERSHLENASGFLRLIIKSERELAVYKGPLFNIWPVNKSRNCCWLVLARVGIIPQLNVSETQFLLTGASAGLCFWLQLGKCCSHRPLSPKEGTAVHLGIDKECD